MLIKSKFGFCEYNFEEDYVHIYNLFVYPEYRRKGKAKELLQNAILNIRKTGWLEEIQIVVDPKNKEVDREKLFDFYKSLGLTVYGCYL